MDMQKLIVSGRATKDAEKVVAKSGREFARFSIAANRYLGKDKESEVTFYDCVSFAKGENLTKIIDRVRKGDMVLIQGRPSVNAYLSKEGEAKGTLKVVLDSVNVIKA